MPLYVFECSECHASVRRLLTPEQAAGDLSCRVEGCTGKLKRQTKPPSTFNKEVISVPGTNKQLERFSDIDRLMEERGKKNYRERE